MPEHENVNIEETQRLVVPPQALAELKQLRQKKAEASATSAVPAVVTPAPVQKQAQKARRISKLDRASIGMLQERCRQICLSLFFREQAPVRSLGFTSAISGEGKSFLATVAALVLANDSRVPVTLLECNWEHPSLHEYFGFAPTPGLAEWLRGECSASDVRHQVTPALTVIPAGEGRGDAVRLLQRLREEGLSSQEVCANDLLIVDLPCVTTTAYGPLAASLVETLLIVVHAGVTPDGLVSEACEQLKDLSVYGLILNQQQSRVPRWIRQLL